MKRCSDGGIKEWRQRSSEVEIGREERVYERGDGGSKCGGVDRGRQNERGT